MSAECVTAMHYPSPKESDLGQLHLDVLPHIPLEPKETRETQTHKHENLSRHTHVSFNSFKGLS